MTECAYGREKYEAVLSGRVQRKVCDVDKRSGCVKVRNGSCVGGEGLNGRKGLQRMDCRVSGVVSVIVFYGE